MAISARECGARAAPTACSSRRVDASRKPAEKPPSGCRHGSCPAPPPLCANAGPGPRCSRYAHGEHELRYVPPEIVAQLEAQQKLQEAGGQRTGGGEGGDRGRGDDAPAAGPGAGVHGGGPGGGHQSFYKTRLCIKYMQTGYCHKGASCTFAHGYEDLRQPGTPISPGRMQQVSPRGGGGGGARRGRGPGGSSRHSPGSGGAPCERQSGRARQAAGTLSQAANKCAWAASQAGSSRPASATAATRWWAPA